MNKIIDIDLLLTTVVRTHKDHGDVIGCLLDIRAYLEAYKQAKKAYIELTNNRDHVNNCYFADNELMDKFDSAFDIKIWNDHA